MSEDLPPPRDRRQSGITIELWYTLSNPASDCETVSTGARHSMAGCENESVSLSFSHSSTMLTRDTLFVSPVDARCLLSRVWPGMSLYRCGAVPARREK